MSNNADDKYFEISISYAAYDNMYHVELTLIKHDKSFYASHEDKRQAVDEVRALCRDWMREQGLLPENITLASDLREQEKVMAGLIEKAKREGLDGRLLAMANTDFERGFMALEKALNTNKG